MKAYTQRVDALSLLDRTPDAMGWMLMLESELQSMIADGGPQKPLAVIGRKLVQELDGAIGVTRAQLLCLHGSGNEALAKRILDEGMVAVSAIQTELNATLDVIERCQTSPTIHAEQTASERS